MPVVYRPPSPDHLIVRRIARADSSALKPWLKCANEVNHVDTGLKMAVGGYILVVCGRSDVVGETQTIIRVLEMHVEEALVRTVE